MIRAIITALFLLATLSTAWAQNKPVYQSGGVTPTHPAMWVTNGVVKDAGGASGGALSAVGITATGLPLCIDDALQTGPYHELCFGANSLGGGLLSYNAYGGATPLPFQFNVNGVSGLSYGALPNAPASTLLGNPTSATAAHQDIAVGSLPAVTPNPSTDRLLLWQSSTNSFKSTAPGSVAGSISFASNNSWTGDQYFGSGRPWCDVRANGATGNGSTNDTAAFTACVTTLDALNGGRIWVPPGNYCLSSGWVVHTSNHAIIIQGGGEDSTVLSACGNNVTPVYLDGAPDSIRDLEIVGDNSLSATNPALYLGAACGQCTADNLQILYGCDGILTDGADIKWISHVSAGLAYCTALLHARGTVIVTQSSFDQGYPGSYSPPVTRSNWTSTTAVSLNQVLIIGQYVVQVTQAGSTGGTAPTVLPYGQTINDGSAKETLAAPSTFYAIDFDGINAIESQVSQTDASASAATYNIYVNGPSLIKLNQIIMTGAHSADIYLNAGQYFSGTQLELGQCGFVSCTNFEIAGTWAGDTTLNGSTILGGAQAIAIATNPTNGSNIFNGNTIDGPTATALSVSAGVGNFIFSNNGVSPTGGANCAAVATGSSDYYNITNNICHGGAVSDGGSGTHKTITGNN